MSTASGDLVAVCFVVVVAVFVAIIAVIFLAVVVVAVFVAAVFVAVAVVAVDAVVSRAFFGSIPEDFGNRDESTITKLSMRNK